MKKLFTILAAILVAGSMWGTDVTFTFKTDKDITYTATGTSGGGAACEVSKGNVTLVGSTSAYTTTGKSLSIYAGSSLTVSVPSGNQITAITATYASQSRPFVEALPNGVTSTTNKLASACSGSWSGSAAQSVTLTNNASGKTELTVLVVTFSSTGGGGSTPTALAVPSNLGSSNVTTTGATLSWDAVANASSYTVKIGETEYTGVNTNSYSATGLTAETQYTWTVKAIGDGVNYSTSAYAANANFTTEAEQGGDPEPTPAGYTYVQTNLSDITATDEVLVVWTKEGSSYALSNDNGTTAAPSAVSVTITDNIITTSADNISWNLTKSESTFVLNPYGDTEKWLYCFNSNNGVRVGIGEAKNFQINDNYLYENGTTDARYLGVYNSQDVRCYTSINSNITGQTLSFFVKRVLVTVGTADYATFASATDFIVNENNVVYYASEVTHEAIEFTALEAGTSVKAGDGLLIKGEGTHAFAPTSDATTLGAANKLVGVLEATDLSAVANAHVLAMDGAVAAFCPVSGGTLAAGKAYIVRPAEAGSAPLRITFADENKVATAIDNVAANNVVKFMKNGQLFIMKAGRVYNVAGQIVR